MPKIPISIVSGFLGSGKTTLLAQILKDEAYKNSAIIINEMGEVGLDDRILASQVSFVAENMVLLKSGCICCNKREDLIGRLKEILHDFEARGENLERVVVETTGLANLTPILFSIQSDVFLSNHFYAESILSCIDSANATSHLQEEICKNQIAFSDIAVLTKLDMCENPSDIKSIKHTLLSINPYLQIYNKKDLPNDIFCHQKTPKIPSKNLPKIPQNSYDMDSIKNGLDGISSFVLRLENAVEWNVFGVWLSFLLYRYGEQILRIKGLIDTKDEKNQYLVAIDGAMHILHTPRHIPKTSNTKHKSEIVFIIKGLDKEKIIESFYAFCG
ncbi:CobW family GTP-binding protein [Helicobacter sp. T3_23-1059]